MPRTQSPFSLAQVLPGVLKKLESEKRPSLEAVQKAWRRLAGQKAARHSWPRSLVRGQLLIEVENSGWMYALNLEKERLLKGLVELLGEDRLKSLRFRIGEAGHA